MRTFTRFSFIAVAVGGLWSFHPNVGQAAGAPQPPSTANTDGYVHSAVKVAKTMAANGDLYDKILAAGALVELGDKAALEMLVHYIEEKDFVIKRTAIDTLLSTSHPNSVDLVMREAERDSVTLTLMTESLAATPREDLEDVLLEALKSDKAVVRKNALQALSRIDTPQVTAAVKKLLDDPHEIPTVKAYGYFSRARTGHGAEVATAALEAAQHGDSGDEREVAAATLGFIDTPASKAALAELSRTDGDGRVKLAAIASSAGLKNDDAIAVLIKTVAYGKPMEATVMAGSIRRLPPDVVHDVTRTLISCCKLTADTATRLLESWGWVDADADFLYQWGLAHADHEVRLQTLWLIGHRKDAKMLERLSGFLTDEDPALRTMAAWAIIHTAGAGYVGGVET